MAGGFDVLGKLVGNWNGASAGWGTGKRHAINNCTKIIKIMKIGVQPFRVVRISGRSALFTVVVALL